MYRTLNFLAVVAVLVARMLFWNRSRMAAEVVALRHQLLVMERGARRPRLAMFDRWLWAFLSERFSGWRDTLRIVEPETVLRWHRALYRFYWRWKSRRTGKSKTLSEAVELIRRFASENPSWGAPRIQGELRKLSVELPVSTIQKWLKRFLPRRGKKEKAGKQTWRTFLRNHAESAWACDFFGAITLGFKTVYVFVILDIASRRVVGWNLTENPTAEWTYR